MDLIRHVVVFDAADVAAVSAFWAAMLDGSVVDEDPPHGLRCHGKEMGAALPVDALLVDEFQECLVDQPRGLQSVARRFPL